MNRGLKITLIVVGSLALAGGITFAIVRSVRKKKEQKEEQERIEIELRMENIRAKRQLVVDQLQGGNIDEDVDKSIVFANKAASVVIQKKGVGIY